MFISQIKNPRKGRNISPVTLHETLVQTVFNCQAQNLGRGRNISPVLHDQTHETLAPPVFNCEDKTRERAQHITTKPTLHERLAPAVFNHLHPGARSTRVLSTDLELILELLFKLLVCALFLVITLLLLFRLRCCCMLLRHLLLQHLSLFLHPATSQQ